MQILAQGLGKWLSYGTARNGIHLKRCKLNYFTYGFIICKRKNCWPWKFEIAPYYSFQFYMFCQSILHTSFLPCTPSWLVNFKYLYFDHFKCSYNRLYNESTPFGAVFLFEYSNAKSICEDREKKNPQPRTTRWGRKNKTWNLSVPKEQQQKRNIGRYAERKGAIQLMHSI